MKTTFKVRKLSRIAFILLLMLSLLLLNVHMHPTVGKRQNSESPRITTEMLDSIQNFSDLDIQERLMVAKEVIALESIFLGVETPEVIIKKLHGPLVADYSEFLCQIRLDRNFLESAEAREFVQVLGHEIYHAYEHRLIQLYDLNSAFQDMACFRKAAIYKEEFKHYISGTDEKYRHDYFVQECEVDASRYGALLWDQYKQALFDYESDSVKGADEEISIKKQEAFLSLTSGLRDKSGLDFDETEKFMKALTNEFTNNIEWTQQGDTWIFDIEHTKGSVTNSAIGTTVAFENVSNHSKETINAIVKTLAEGEDLSRILESVYDSESGMYMHDQLQFSWKSDASSSLKHVVIHCISYDQ